MGGTEWGALMRGEPTPSTQIRCSDCGETWDDVPLDHSCTEGDQTYDVLSGGDKIASVQIPTPSKPCTEGAGRVRCQDCGETWDNVPRDHSCGINDPPEGLVIAPLGTRGHCFCVSNPMQHSVMNHRDVLCCWCREPKCITTSREPVSGHGPYRTELVKE